MKTTIIREGETLGMLSARLGVPGCMILRANGLFSEAWLLPGRHIDVPDADYCAQAQAPCPVQEMMKLSSGEFCVGMVDANFTSAFSRRSRRPSSGKTPVL